MGSQGEQQLLCLARVLLDSADSDSGASAKPRVLLCDEPTSACDLGTDKLIHKTLLYELPKEGPDAWTLLVICHRLHRIEEFDAVYILDGGKATGHGEGRGEGSG